MLRQRLQLTATELAAEAGLSPGMLSKIENGGTSPSLSTLQALARALNVPMTGFFADFEERRDCSYVRAGQGVLIERRGTKSGHRYELLGHSISGDIVVEPYLITLSEDAEPYALFQHDGVEFIYMLTGKVVYRHADKLYPMAAGRRAVLRRRRAARAGGADRAADDLSLDHHLSAQLNFPKGNFISLWVDERLWPRSMVQAALTGAFRPMCGIVGLFLKDPALEPELGRLTAGMLATMSRPRAGQRGLRRLWRGQGRRDQADAARGPRPRTMEETVGAHRAAPSTAPRATPHDTHAVVVRARRRGRRSSPTGSRASARTSTSSAAAGAWRSTRRSACPTRVAERFDLAAMAGTHAIGHTRMATESAVTTDGAHPYSTGADQCLVHNGSLSNHNNLRRVLVREGITFETENDTEVAAGYLTWRMRKGMTLGEALEGEPRRPRRLLHLRRRHRERLRRAARRHRLQARGDGRDRPLRRLRLGVSRACRPARHRERAASGSRSPRPSISGSASHAGCRSRRRRRCAS